MASRKVDVNVAGVEELEGLVGVGHAKALSILQTRRVHDGFNSVSDLMKVPRIGPSVIEQNRCVLFCSSPTSPGTRHHSPSNKCQRETRSSAKAELRFMNCDGSPKDENDADTEEGEGRGEEEGDADASSSSSEDDFQVIASRTRAAGLLNKERGRASQAATRGADVHDGLTPSTSRTEHSHSSRMTVTPSSSFSSSTSSFTSSLCRQCVSNNRKQVNKDLPSTSRGSSSASTHNVTKKDKTHAYKDNDSDKSSDDNDTDASSQTNVSDTADDDDDPMDAETAGDGDDEAMSRDANRIQEKIKMEENNMAAGSPTFTIRSRIPVRIFSANSKSWMKRKCDSSSLDMRGLSPGKKPCRGSQHLSSLEPETSYDALRSKTNSQAMQRHRRIPSKSNPPPELADWLKTFQSWSNAERLLALDELIEYCEPTQVRHMMSVIEPQFQRDFISLLPKELALYVLTFLGPKDLLRAAQTCRYWRILAEDNLLWREKCREESIEESAVFGNNKIGRKSCPSSPRSPWKNLYMRQHQIEQNWRSGVIRIPKVLKGHDDHVITCLEFSGSRIVSGSDDNTLKVWSALTGKCLRTLVGHTGGVWSSQMAGHIIISGSTDRTLKVWNADTGQCIHTLYGHTSTVRCMHLYKNRVVSGSRDATLRLWDIDSGECLHVLMGHVAAVRCVQYDGRRVVSGAYDYMVKIWDPETETCIHTLQGHTNRVYSLQFDGAHIVSGSLDTSIRVWDVESGNCLHTLIGHQSLTSGMELKDNILVSGNADSTVKVWDITTGQCLQTLQGPNKHQSAVTCLQFNKKFVITSSDDGTVKIWDLRTGEFLRNLVALDSGGSGGVVWRVRSNNTKLVCAVGSRNGTEETKLLVLDFDVEEGKKAIT